MKSIKVAISPCPNDTFSFFAALHGKVDTAPFEFQSHFLPIDQLNMAASQGQFDLIKVSALHYARNRDHYRLLNVGAALGQGVGPLLVVRRDRLETLQQLPPNLIGVPGPDTTAAFLAHCYLDGPFKAVQLPFSEIIEQLQDGKIDAGTVIHESRFHLQEARLGILQDLGIWWELTHHVPLPLGVLVAKPDFSIEECQRLEEVLRASILFAKAHWNETMDFVLQHAQENNTTSAKRHIDLYVNEYSLDLGKLGRSTLDLLTKLVVDKH